MLKKQPLTRKLLLLYLPYMKEIAPRIIIDPKIRFGKPVIKGTRVTVEEILGFLAGGMTFEEIEREYDLKKNDIMVAIEYAAAFLKGEEIKIPKPVKA